MGAEVPEGGLYQQHKDRFQIIDYKALIDEECASVGNDITQLFAGEPEKPPYDVQEHYSNFHIHITDNFFPQFLKSFLCICCSLALTGIRKQHNSSWNE